MKGIQLKNKSDKTAEMLIYEDIGEGFFTSGVTAQGFLKDLKALGDVNTIDIRINSNGGSVFDGIAIYNALKRHPAQKNVYVDGIAASIASIIAMAGDSITMGDGTFLMIHKASGLAMGNATDMRATADILEGIDAQLVDIYATKTGMDAQTLSDMMDAETWMNATDSIEMGFANELGDVMKIAAHANFERFHNIPEALTNSHSGPTEVPDEPEVEIITPVITSTLKKETTMNIMESLKARAAEHQAAAGAVRTKANDEGRDLTKAERQVIENELSAFEAVTADIELQNRLESAEDYLNKPAGRKISPDGLQNTVTRTTQEKNRAGFNHFGEFIKSVKDASISGGKLDPRLVANAATTYGQEGVGADGGFAVPPEWRSQIMELVAPGDSLLSMTDQVPISGNSVTFPVDETTAHQSTGGILAYWDSEAAAMTASKPNLKDLTVKTSRLTALVPVTEELMEDASAMGAYVQRKAGEKMNFKVTDAIVNGTGVGQPLGILNAPCLIAQAAEGSQTADTVHAYNIVKMMARMPAASFNRSVWLVNQDVLPQILGMGMPVKLADGTAAGGGGSMYMAPNGISQAPYGTLLGRPIVVTEACQTVGDAGDIILADMSKYLSVVKTGGIRSDVSMHFYFDQNISAFRFVMRMNGQPWLSAPIAKKHGSNTLSHFVSLVAR
jgi:HK97 family phage major capsid protein